MEKQGQFPKDFFWGAATSAHQVEGENYNDWSEWEIANAKIKSQNAKLTSWPDYILRNYPNPLQGENYISGAACDHYHRFREDFDTARSLGHNAHRFSIEWSRIEPQEGKFDEQEIGHYREVIRALREREMEPFVTLWHWTSPLWIRDGGGWENKKTVDLFLRYVKIVAQNLGHEIRYYIPVNEPAIYAALGYIRGTQPPEITSLRRAHRVLKNLLEAHKKAFALLHATIGSCSIGISHSISYRVPYAGYPWNRLLVRILNRISNENLLDEVKNFSDFIGVQYYQREEIDLKIGGSQLGIIERMPCAATNDLGWGMDPEGLRFILHALSRYRKPIIITENGIADARDKHRAWYITSHIEAMKRAMAEGVDIRGYFHWSLLDNFEMPEGRGFWPRFGLVEVDYKTMARNIRPSALVYKEIIRKNLI